MSAGLIKQARVLLKKKEYSQIIKLLEPNIYQFRDNFNYYFLLGVSCLQIGDIGGASSYLNRAMQLKQGDIDCQLCTAMLHLKKYLYRFLFYYSLELLKWVLLFYFPG